MYHCPGGGLHISDFVGIQASHCAGEGLQTFHCEGGALHISHCTGGGTNRTKLNSGWWGTNRTILNVFWVAGYEQNSVTYILTYTYI